MAPVAFPVSEFPTLALGAGNGTLAVTVKSLGLSAQTDGFFESTWAVSEGGAPTRDPPVTLAPDHQTADMRTGEVTGAFVGPGATVATTALALRVAPNVVLHRAALTATGGGGTFALRHAITAPARASDVSFTSTTFLTPGATSLVRTVFASGWVGAKAPAVQTRVAYVWANAPPAAQHLTLVNDDRTTHWTVFPAALAGGESTEVTAFVIHGLNEEDSMRVAADAADALLAGTLEAGNDAAANAATSFGVALVGKSGVSAEEAADVAFHQAQCANAVRVLNATVARAPQVGPNAEMWLFPALLLLRPNAARAFVDFRVDTLPAARAAARAAGRPGARFPYLAGTAGEERSNGFTSNLPRTLYNSALVAVAAWNYYRVSHDREWLESRGFALMRDVADHLCALLAKGYGRNADGVVNSMALGGVLDAHGVAAGDHSLTNVAVYLAIKGATEATFEIGGYLPKAAWLDFYNAVDANGVHPLISHIENAGVLVRDPSSTFPPLASDASDAWTVAWPLLFADYASDEAKLAANAPYYSGATTIAQASLPALRAQVGVAHGYDRTADVMAAHATVSDAMAAAAAAGGGVVQDPVTCAAYLLFLLTIYGQLHITGGTTIERYVYEPYGVLRPTETGGVLPTHWATLMFACDTDAGTFQISNQL